MLKIKKIKDLVKFCLPFFCMVLVSQNETNNWYFGDKAGLSFESQQNSEVLFNGEIIGLAGCSTISDKAGNLQFYTNGTVVWSKDHSIMINGFLLLGERNASQNSIIIPFTDDIDKYYIFTVGTSGGLFYSIVDMSFNNGLGEVIEKNTRLLPFQGVGKISAVHHADGKSIWIMTTKKNENNQYTSFYAYKINTNGSIEEPIITSDGLFYEGLQEGIMKFSPDGKKIACANYRPQALSNHLFVFDFNPQTGVISNKRNLFTTIEFFEVVSAYGVEFSNDSKYLYATLVKQGLYNENSDDFVSDEIRKNMVYQYDLSNTNPWENSIPVYEGLDDERAAGIQLAKDGKIYRALVKSESEGSNFLGVINNPNIMGIEANYAHNAISLNPKKSRLGLPNFIQSYFRTRILTEEGCLNNPILFEVDTYAEITDAEWDFGDGNISNEISPNHIYTTSGSFDASVKITINNREIEVSKKITIHDIPTLFANQELIQCDTDTDGISIFNLFNIKEKITNLDLNENLFFYENESNALQDINAIPNPENYTNKSVNQEIFVKVVNDNDCFSITSFFINATFVTLGNIEEMYACENTDKTDGDIQGVFFLVEKKNEIRNQYNLHSSATLKFYPTLLDAQTTKNELIKKVTTVSTTIWLRVENSDLSCSGIEPVDLIVLPKPKIDIKETYIMCNELPITLYGDIVNDRYEWLNSDGDILSNEQYLTINTTGTYTHIAYKIENGLECSQSKTFFIDSIEPPVFNAIEIGTESNRNTIFVDVEGENTYEFSINNLDFYGNSNTYTFKDILSGVYTIYVRDIDHCQPTIQKKVYIIGYPKFFTPNNDGINDYWEIKGLDENTYKTIKISVFDRYGKLIINLNNKNGFIWDGTYKGTLLTTGDYWFKAVFNDGKIKKGHITLKR